LGFRNGSSSFASLVTMRRARIV
jgi:hypothetical protein